MNKTYFQNLDALRFFAFCSVFLAHAILVFDYKFSIKILQTGHSLWFSNGDIGVSFFFVLSGFLISWLLFEEKTNKGIINIKSFYARRVLRIWPVYYLVVAIGFISAYYIDWSFIKNMGFVHAFSFNDLPLFIFLLGNVPMIRLTAINAILSPLWSIAIEEQFYLIWPWLFSFFSAKTVKYTCYSIIMSYFILKFFFTISYYSLFNALPSLSFGALAAYYSFYHPEFIEYFKKVKRYKIVIIYILILIYIPLHGLSHKPGQRFFDLYIPFEVPLFSLLFAFIILEQNFSSNSFFKFGRLKRISNLGKISYGLYAYHMITLPICYYLINNGLKIDNTSFLSYLFKMASAFLLTVIISKVSYKYMESFFLQYKKKFS